MDVHNEHNKNNKDIFMKEYRYISLGQRCNPGRFFKRHGLRKASYPFDWMLSPIESTGQLLALLLKEEMPVEELVREEFLPFSRMIGCNHWQRRPEHYVTYQDKSGRPYNVKYRQCFPHEPALNNILHSEPVQKQLWDKYTRRFNRLKEDITRPDIPICFVMEIIHGIYTLDDKPTWSLETTPVALENIVNLLTSFNSENQFVLFGKQVPFSITPSTERMQIHPKIPLLQDWNLP